MIIMPKELIENFDAMSVIVEYEDVLCYSYYQE